MSITREQAGDFVLLSEKGSRDLSVTLRGTIVAHCDAASGEVRVHHAWQSRAEDIHDVTRGWSRGLREYPPC